MGECLCGEAINYDDEVELRHFELLRSVGKGAFGKVRIVMKKNDKKVYALKYINKLKCCKMKAVNNIIQERKLLEEIDYPLIVNLKYAFQDDENLFMVMDLMLGGDIRFHLDRTGSLSEEVVRFFVAEIASSFKYLHDKRIVHRDIKPDNVLLDEHGHTHLTDFNIAVRYSEVVPLKSVAGSMAYMAPEVVGRKGYFETPDWWSLGVMMYEMIYGKRPFRGKTNDALTNSILNDELHFPTNPDLVVSKECTDVICGLLERNTEKRLGCGKNWDTLKNHPFFQKQIGKYGPIVWEDIPLKKVAPPFVPDSKRANFDASHELEELLLEENPLRARKRSEKKNYAKLPGGENGDYAKGFQIMETKYTVFDYQKKKILENNSSIASDELKVPGGLNESDSMQDLSNIAPDETSKIKSSQLDPDISINPNRENPKV